MCYTSPMEAAIPRAAVNHEWVLGQAAALTLRSRQLCLRAGDLMESTRAIRAVSYSLRRILVTPSIRGGADGEEGCPPRAPLPETRQRRCPTCKGNTIRAANHLFASEGMTKEEFRCLACGTAFWILETNGAAFWVSDAPPERPPA